MRFRIFKKKIFLVILLVVLFILAYNFTALGQFGVRAREVFFYIGSPLYRAGRSLGSSWYGLTHGLALQKKLDVKEEALAHFAAENAKLNWLKDENRELRQLLGFSGSIPQTVIPASVLSYDTTGGRSAIVVGEGSNSGVREKLAVVASSGVLIGKVVKVTPNTATVLLTVDNDSSIAASLASTSSVQAIVKGKMGLSLTLELVPQDTALVVGDIVVTSALEENTPSGLVIGKVAAVFYKEGELFKRANLEPLLSPLSIKTVGIILPAL